jgi:DNA-directed RNA polymerase specialized sigma24 family protein
MSSAQPPSQRQDFSPTQWSVVRRAQAAGGGDAEALAELCRNYWLPLFGYLRGLQHDAHTAEDLVQGFFAEALEQRLFAQARPEGGRFRSFLLTCLGEYAERQARRAVSEERVMQRVMPDLSPSEAEARYATELVDRSGTPEDHFDRLWATTLLNRALTRLRSQHQGKTSLERFELLKPFLSKLRGESAMEAAATEMGLSISAIKSAIFRLRQRYGEAIRDELRELATNEADVQDELRHLLRCLTSAD